MFARTIPRPTPESELLADPGLPEVCYSADAGPGELVAIKRGQMGYYPVDTYQEHWQAEAMAANKNRLLGVTAEQRQAMVIGSMFGWHVPGARVS